jgi:hypothetical protein
MGMARVRATEAGIDESGLTGPTPIPDLTPMKLSLELQPAVVVEIPPFLEQRLRDMLTGGYALDFHTVLKARVLELLYREANL